MEGDEGALRREDVRREIGVILLEGRL